MLKTRITEQYGLKVPFINAGMAFIATAPLVMNQRDGASPVAERRTDAPRNGTSCCSSTAVCTVAADMAVLLARPAAQSAATLPPNPEPMITTP